MNTPIESKKQDRRLTTTSYALLAALALRDHSTYELAKQIRMGWRYFWPRAESNVYAEPKRLLAVGLATSRRESTGQRPRTVYSITAAGRAELADWLASPSRPARYESEAVLKVFFAENGTLEDMLASIRTIRDDAAAGIEHFQRIADLYERDEGQYPRRFALSALVVRLLAEQQAAALRWAEWAEQVVSHWGTSSGADPAWGVETIRATGEAFTSPAETPSVKGGGHAAKSPADRGE
jgi:DNA-binding PadR family transcriptional regulator